MEISPTNTHEVPDIIESINIEQNNQNFILTIKIIGEIILLTISEPEEINNITYSRKLTLNEIKNCHKWLQIINSCNEFLDYLKSLSECKKLMIQKNEGKIFINFNVECLLKKEKVEIELFQNKLNLDSLVLILSKEIKLLKEKNNIFIKENIDIKNENINTKNEITNLQNGIKDLQNEIKVLRDENINSKYENTNLKNEIKDLKNENINLKNEIKDMKNENINLKNEIKEIKNILEPINKKFNKSDIMK